MRQPRSFVVEMKGGIDLTTPALKASPSTAITLINYEPELSGGYRRIAGYEAFDGRSAPSDAVYYTVEVADASGISVGDTLTGDSSGETSKVVIISSNTLGVTELFGSYTANEAANGTTISSIEARSGQADLDTDNIWQQAAEDYYRDLIQALPGSGDVLGAVTYGSSKYAFRSDGTNAVMYKSSTSGWTAVTFYRLLYFTAGLTGSDAVLIAGAVVDGGTSNAQGTIKSIVQNGGSWDGSATGYMVIDVTSGSFQDVEPIQISAVTKATTSSVDTAIALSPGGKFQFIEHNYYGGASTKNLYGCDGVNPAWEYDGSVFTPIYHTAPDLDPSWNTPKYLAAFSTYLFISIPGGRLAHSSLGTPLVFDGRMAAAEFGLGSECTGLASRAGEVLSIYTKEGRTYGLYGSDPDTWVLKTISETFGAKDYTVAQLGTAYAIDDKGIVPMERVQSFGDFEGATVSRKVKPILDFYKNSIVQSIIVKERNQYRVFFTDGSGLIMADDRMAGSASRDFTAIKYPDIPTCMSNSEDDSGSEVILFGDNTGMVYQAEKGRNFNGAEIESVYRTQFMHGNSPHLNKAWRRAWLNIDAQQHITSMKLSWGMDYESPYRPSHKSNTPDIKGGGGYWNIDLWDDFYWDSEQFSSAGNRLAGTGINISFLLYSSSKYDNPYTIQSMELEYIPRNRKRAV